MIQPLADLGENTSRVQDPHYFGLKKQTNKQRGKKSRQVDTHKRKCPLPPFSSRSGSATDKPTFNWKLYIVILRDCHLLIAKERSSLDLLNLMRTVYNILPSDRGHTSLPPSWPLLPPTHWEEVEALNLANTSMWCQAECGFRREAIWGLCTSIEGYLILNKIARYANLKVPEVPPSLAPHTQSGIGFFSNVDHVHNTLR